MLRSTSPLHPQPPDAVRPHDHRSVNSVLASTSPLHSQPPDAVRSHDHLPRERSLGSIWPPQACRPDVPLPQNHVTIPTAGTVSEGAAAVVFGTVAIGAWGGAVVGDGVAVGANASSGGARGVGVGVGPAAGRCVGVGGSVGTAVGAAVASAAATVGVGVVVATGVPGPAGRDVGVRAGVGLGTSVGIGVRTADLVGVSVASSGPQAVSSPRPTSRLVTQRDRMVGILSQRSGWTSNSLFAEATAGRDHPEWRLALACFTRPSLDQSLCPVSHRYSETPTSDRFDMAIDNTSAASQNAAASIVVQSGCSESAQQVSSPRGPIKGEVHHV